MLSGKLGTVAVGYTIWQALTMARVFALVMILPTDEFGLIAAITIIVLFCEIGIDPRWDIFLIKAHRSEQREYQGTIHALYLIKGIIVAALMYLTSSMSSSLFHAADHGFSFQIIAIIPLISGFMHTDCKRQQADSNFKPEIFMINAGEIAYIIASLPLAYLLETHFAGVVGLIARSSAMTIATHITRQREYRIEFDASKLSTLFSFGTPLFFNGVIMYLSAQIDRVTVGIFTDPASLGVYSMILQVINAPAAVIMRATGNVTLPLLAAAHNDVDRDKKARVLVENGLIGIGFLFALFAILFVSDVIGLLLGARYKPEVTLVLAVALSAAFRIMRVWPTQVALSQHRTKQVLGNTLTRAALMPLSVLAGYSGLGLVAVSSAMLLGEMISFVVAVRGITDPSRDGFFSVWRNTIMSIAILMLAGAFVIALSGSVIGVVMRILIAASFLTLIARKIFKSYRAYIP